MPKSAILGTCRGTPIVYQSPSAAIAKQAGERRALFTSAVASEPAA